MPLRSPIQLGPWPKGVDNIHPAKDSVFQNPGRNEPPARLKEAVNVDLSAAGWPSTTLGELEVCSLTSVLSAEFHDGFVYVQDAIDETKSVEFKVNPTSGVKTEVISDLDPGAPITFHAHAGQLLWSNGLVKGRIDANHNVLSWGCAVAPTPTLSAVAGTALTAGRYLCTTQFVDSSGIEHGAPKAAAITLDGTKALRVALSAIDSSAVSVNIYLSVPNGTEMFYHSSVLVASLPATITTQAPTRDVVRTMGLAPPIPTTVLGSFRGYMLLGVENFVFPSLGPNVHLYEIGSQTLGFPAPVITVLGLQTGFWVLTASAAYWVTGGDSPETWTTPDSATMAFAQGGSVITGNYVTGLQLPQQQVAAFLSEFGPAFGTDDGIIIIPTRESYRVDVEGKRVKIVPRALIKAGQTINQLVYLVR